MGADYGMRSEQSLLLLCGHRGVVRVQVLEFKFHASLGDAWHIPLLARRLFRRIHDHGVLRTNDRSVDDDPTLAPGPFGHETPDYASI